MASERTPEEDAARKARKAAKKAAKLASAQSAAPLNGNIAVATTSAPIATDLPNKKRKKSHAEPAATVAVAEPAASIAPSSKGSKKRKLEANGSTPPAKPSEPSTSDFFARHSIAHEPESAASLFPAMESFSALDVPEGLRAGFADFKQPTPIQAAAWPVLLSGRDVIGIAETGSGKTLGFGVPALKHILSLSGGESAPPMKKKSKKSKKGAVDAASASKPAVLVIAPTRELAMQTHDTVSTFGKTVGIHSVCVYGGVDKQAQRDELAAGARVVSGTPGRLLDLAGNEDALDLSEISFLVLDEADRMLDKGFLPELRQIIALCGVKEGRDTPTPRLTAMFSATWPPEVRQLAKDFLRDPIRVTVGRDELTASANVAQSVRVIDDPKKKDGPALDVLRETGFELKVRSGDPARDKVIVFALYKKEADRVHKFFAGKGYAATCINGDMSQTARSNSLADFKAGRSAILVATDVAARGLDLPKVELVLNYTFPLTIEDYIHRIGRTGRAGRKGKAITFFTVDDKAHAGELQRVLKDGGHDVPEGLRAFGGTIRKSSHAAYGAHFRDDIKGTATKIKF